MLGKKNKQANYDRPTTVIGRDTSIETGTLESEKSVQVNGRIMGNIDVKESLVVGEEGYVEGEIRARFVLVAGKVVGNIQVSQQIHLTETARVIGDIECESIIIDDGAKIEGNFSMQSIEASEDTEN